MGCERGILVPASDNLPARCVGPWSADKLFYIRSYLEIFSRAMREKFPVRHYLDLFAGPGRCVLDDESGEIEGSPIAALNIPFRFTKYHFVDSDPVAMAALKTRVELAGGGGIAAFYEGDVNDLIDTVVGGIPVNALSVAVVDPTGLHLHFETLRRLTDRRRVDLIYVFPEGMAVKRNLEKFLGERTSPLDEVLGSSEWRARARIQLGLPDPHNPDQQWEEVGRPIVELLRQGLNGLGYQEIRLGSEIVIKNTRNVPLYYLVFASKHHLGHTFWDAIRRVGPTGQVEFPF